MRLFVCNRVGKIHDIQKNSTNFEENHLQVGKNHDKNTNLSQFKSIGYEKIQ